MVISHKEVHDWNAFSPIPLKLLGKVIFCNEVHFSNASDPMFVISSGKTTSFKELHSQNVVVDIEVSLCENSIFESCEHPQNVYPSMH